MLAMVEKDAPIAQLVRDRDSRTEVLTEGARRNIMRGQRVARLWRMRGRQTLAMHPEVVREIQGMTSRDRIPTDVLRALPYINPMVVYADPPVFPSWEKLTGLRSSDVNVVGMSDTMRLIGFFTHGHSYEAEQFLEKVAADPESIFSDTTDGDARMFGVLAIFEILNDKGQVIDLECNTMSVPFGVVEKLGDLVEDLANRFAFDTQGGNRSETSENPQVRKWLRQVMSTILGTLFYLCSTTLEAESVPASVTRHFRHTFARRPLSLYRIGWTTGAALTRYRQAKERAAPSEQQDIAHEQDPQHRRAHIKVVWTGKGKTIPKVAFVSPYWTKVHLLGQQGINTVRGVPRDREQPVKESLRTATGLRP
jgi:hypothetical protein